MKYCSGIIFVSVFELTFYLFVSHILAIVVVVCLLGRITAVDGREWWLMYDYWIIFLMMAYENWIKVRIIILAGGILTKPWLFPPDVTWKINQSKVRWKSWICTWQSSLRHRLKMSLCLLVSCLSVSFEWRVRGRVNEFPRVIPDVLNCWRIRIMCELPMLAYIEMTHCCIPQGDGWRLAIYYCQDSNDFELPVTFIYGHFLS